MLKLLGRRSLKYSQFKAVCCRTISASHAESSDRLYAIENLAQRGILRVQGSDVYSYLQGLITNDVRHLESSNAMYTLFLNVKGRVMCDTIIYKTTEENVLLIECDTSYIDSLKKHLKLYRVRRKIDIDTISDQLRVWVFYKPIDVDISDFAHSGVSCINSVASETLEFVRHHDDVIVCRDPRVTALGYRIIAPANENIQTVFENKVGSSLLYNGMLNYRAHRYILGVGEGIVDIPPGVSFPLEANSDYLHGVSFHKGCYIGQELTARTYHTGVIRKRLMPILFPAKPDTEIPPDTPIHALDSPRKALGKLRAVEHNFGLGLLRITEALAAKQLNVMENVGETFRPQWWPQEAPKDRIAVSREA